MPFLITIAMIMIIMTTVTKFHDNLSNFFDTLITVKVLGNLKNSDFLRKKNTKGVILKQKGTRMTENEED